MSSVTYIVLYLCLSLESSLGFPPGFVDDLFQKESKCLMNCTRIILTDSKDPNSIHLTKTLLMSQEMRNGPTLLLDIDSNFIIPHVQLERRYCQLFFILLNPCTTKVLKLLQDMSDHKLIGFSYHYVMQRPINSTATCTKVLSFFSYTLYLEWNDQVGLVSLTELSPRGIWDQTGYWTPKIGLRLFYPKLFENKLHVDILRTGCIPKEPPIYTWVDFPNGTRRIMGHVIDMYDYLVAYSGNEYVLIPVPDDEEDVYGKIKNGSWVGVMGMLVNEEIEVIAANLAHTTERYSVADHTTNTVHLRIHFAVRKADLLPKWRALFWPYDTHSWYVIIASIFLTILAHWLILWITKTRSGLSTSFISTISILFGRGFRFYNHFFSERILLTMWILYSMIIIYGYGGLLKSSLVAPVKVKEVKTYMDLALSHAHSRLAFKTSGYFHQIMQKYTENEAFQLMLQDKKIIDIPTSYERILSVYTRRTDAALNILDSVIELLGLEHEVVLSKESIFIGNPYFYVQNNSRYKEKLNEGINYYRSSGLDLFNKKRSIRFFKELFKEKYKITEIPWEPTDVLTLYNVQGSFYGLILGLSVSFLAFGGEVISYYFYKEQFFNRWHVYLWT
ncbi:glutamate receptor ionotropic, NMDA 3B [Lepeophtheirus salmonis]|nr:uncharacterized protein LOC121123623 [Lepeophtheirus salmonis]